MTNKDIKAVIKEINKAFGDNTAVILGEQDTEVLDVERVSSGSLNLDLALGGGLPLGRIVEIYGPESSGKTTIALLHAAEMQKAYPDKYILFVDLEHSLNPKLAIKYGIDDKRLIITQPDTGEQALDVVESFIRSGLISLAIIDSVTALTPAAEAEGTMADQQIGLLARLMSKALRKLVAPAAKYNTEIIFINQLREKVGVLYGNPETTPGGRALKFYSSVRIEVRSGERITNKNEVIGHIVNAKVAKNKTGMPFRKASFELIYGEGVDRVKEIVDIALLAGYVNRAGSYYQIKDENGDIITRNGTKLSFQGKDSFANYLKEDTELLNILEEAIRSGIKPGTEEITGTK